MLLSRASRTVIAGATFLAAAAFGLPAQSGGLPAKFGKIGDCSARFAAAKEDAFGIDVSAYQKQIDWQAVAAKTGVLYTFIRASYGFSVDEKFQENWTKSGEKCLLRAPYHFFVEKDDPTAQAQQLYEHLKTYGADQSELPVAADIERGSAKQEICKDPDRRKDFVKRVFKFVVEFESISDRPMAIYTSKEFWDCLPNTQNLSKGRDLWVAEYTRAKAPQIPGGWKNWTFWQFNDDGKVAGIDGNVDADRFAGSGPDLLKYAESK